MSAPLLLALVQRRVSLASLSDHLASLLPSQCSAKHLGINHLCGVVLGLLQQPTVSVTSVELNLSPPGG